MANRKKSVKAKKAGNGANLGFEAKLWLAADKLRGNMDAADYKHVVLGLIFLKYISDAFQERYQALKAEPHADPEDRDESTAENVFWVPKDARWSYLQGHAKQPEIGKLIDDGMDAIEKANPTLKGVLPKNYARESIDKHRLGELIDLVGTIGLGDKESRSQDILGRVYEYFLGQFAAAEGKKGGEFYTPRCVVRLLVEMIEPYKGRVLDPSCIRKKHAMGRLRAHRLWVHLPQPEGLSRTQAGLDHQVRMFKDVARIRPRNTPSYSLSDRLAALLSMSL